MNNLYDSFDQLVSWYAQVSKGQSEREFRNDLQHVLCIETLDNPGWMVKIGGEWGRRNIKIDMSQDESDWIAVFASDSEFRGYGDVHCLSDILYHAASWLDLISNVSIRKESSDLDSVFQVLELWFSSKCDGKWEHENGVRIRTLDNPGWLVKVDGELSKSTLCVKSDKVERNDWFRVDATAEEFEGVGDPSKIELILKYLNSWLVTEAKAGIPR